MGRLPLEVYLGLDVLSLQALVKLEEAGHSFGESLTLGRQRLAVAGIEAKSCSVDPDAVALKEEFSESLLLEHFGAARVSSIDASAYEGASIIQDLNQPKSLGESQWDTILDFGTMEHVFEAPELLRSVKRGLRVGGIALHVVPTNNLVGHGIYQFGPEFFLGFYSLANGFQVSAFAATNHLPDKWLPLPNLQGSERIGVATKTVPTSLIIFAKKVRETEIETNVYQGDYEADWEASAPRQIVNRSDLRRRIGLLPGIQKLYRLTLRFRAHLSPIVGIPRGGRLVKWSSIKVFNS